MSVIVLCDIDGVLANCQHRLKFIQSDKKDYDKFYSDREISKDGLIFPGYELVRVLGQYGELHFVTGRNERCRYATMAWLRSIFGRSSLIQRRTLLAMRNDNDYRLSPVVKVELVREVLKELHDEKGVFTTQDVKPVYFIDDDPENVKAVEKAFPSITGIVFTTKRF